MTTEGAGLIVVCYPPTAGPADLDRLSIEAREQCGALNACVLLVPESLTPRQRRRLLG